MEKYLKILKKCSLFYGISDDNLLKMLTCLGAKIINFDKKYTIFAEGTTAKYIGIMLSGTAHTVQMDYFGNRSVLSVIKPTHIFGEAFACAEAENVPVSVIASEPCEVMLIDCGHILHTCSNNCGFHQQLIFNLMKVMASKNLRFHQKIEITSKRTTREKLMTYLMLEAKKNHSDSFEIPYDRQELADYLEVERSGLSAEIGKLRREGVLLSEKNKFTLLEEAE
jgi:CRP-like cAMP-binding protein